MGLKKYFRINKDRKRIGYIVEKEDEYYSLLASTRLRCYDILKYFKESNEFIVELYRKSQNYDIIIFQKLFNEEYFNLAKKIKKKHPATKLILDINVNYLSIDVNLQFTTKKQKTDIMAMLNIVDFVISSSENLKRVYNSIHSNVFCIEENVSDEFFNVKKKHNSNINGIYLMYCGYSVKAYEILSIKHILLRLHKKYDTKLLFITEKDPQLNIIPYEYIKYDQKKLPKLLLKGDIKIAPRDLSKTYNLGHSFTKVAYPMAVGISAVASPVPSYLNRRVIICDNDYEWEKNLEYLICNPEVREFYGNLSCNFIKNNYSNDIIGSQYSKLFSLICDEKTY